jgi:oligopeptide transport system ATP-binding protein
LGALLEIRDLVVEFQTLDGTVHAANGVNYSVADGQTLGLVGESGCGKTVSALTAVRLLQEPPARVVSGQVLYRGQDLLKLDKAGMQSLRGKEIAMVFQDPMNSLNPVLTISEQIGESMVAHLGLSRAEARQRAAELLEMVGIPNPVARLDDYPHQFSGGQRQRAMLAMALACSPALLIADEPTTALDVTIQAQIIDLVKNLRDRLGMTVLWITHDLGVVAELADRVAVMYSGYVVETADVFDIFEAPHHPYTLMLLRSLPRLDIENVEKLASIPGAPPDLLTLPPGCPFAPRCAYVQERCRLENPPLAPVDRAPAGGHLAACWVTPDAAGLGGRS